MRALSGKKAPERVNDPIIYHGDVRRMLLTSKVWGEDCVKGRALSVPALVHARPAHAHPRPTPKQGLC